MDLRAFFNCQFAKSSISLCLTNPLVRSTVPPLPHEMSSGYKGCQSYLRNRANITDEHELQRRKTRLEQLEAEFQRSREKLLVSRRAALKNFRCAGDGVAQLSSNSEKALSSSNPASPPPSLDDVIDYVPSIMNTTEKSSLVRGILAKLTMASDSSSSPVSSSSGMNPSSTTGERSLADGLFTNWVMASEGSPNPVPSSSRTLHHSSRTNQGTEGDAVLLNGILRAAMEQQQQRQTNRSTPTTIDALRRHLLERWMATAAAGNSSSSHAPPQPQPAHHASNSILQTRQLEDVPYSSSFERTVLQLYQDQQQRTRPENSSASNALRTATALAAASRNSCTTSGGMPQRHRESSSDIDAMTLLTALSSRNDRAASLLQGIPNLPSLLASVAKRSAAEEHHVANKRARFSFY